ncbi:cysteine-rich DPF motif domain-containing protein 1 isoform X3 [Heptranchias perlo]|uniref:cysteine-rich DPF motif domain-containing protein 1 isoform X3 n=1 Tax=Heptranchias perlo TaxID=212740 RepID=UPI00355A7664
MEEGDGTIRSGATTTPRPRNPPPPPNGPASARVPPLPSTGQRNGTRDSRESADSSTGPAPPPPGPRPGPGPGGSRCAGILCEMQSIEEPEPKGEFECRLCGLRVPYSYYGQKPPNARSIVLLEVCYTMNDPFTPHKDKFLILGSHCSLCNNAVCVGQLRGKDISPADSDEWNGVKFLH